MVSLILGSLKGSEEQLTDKGATSKGGDGAGAATSMGGTGEGANAREEEMTTIGVEGGQPEKVRSDAKEEQSSCGKGRSGEATDVCVEAIDAGA